MSNIQAALGLAQIEQLDKIIAEKGIYNIYFKELEDLEKYKFIRSPYWGQSSHWLNALLIKNIDELNIENIILKFRIKNKS